MLWLTSLGRHGQRLTAKGYAHTAGNWDATGRRRARSEATIHALRRGKDRERERAMTEEPLVFLRKVGDTPSRESTTPHSEEEGVFLFRAVPSVHDRFWMARGVLAGSLCC
jgi:hypothetical protein